MSVSVRKNITLEKNIFDKISAYAKMKGISFSEFLRETALKEIARSEEISLLEFMNENVSYVSEEEQAYFDNLKINFDDNDGRELSLDDIL